MIGTLVPRVILWDFDDTQPPRHCGIWEVGLVGLGWEVGLVGLGWAEELCEIWRSQW